MERWISLLGILFFLFAAWAMSIDRKVIPWRTVIWGLILQFTFALLVLGVPALGIAAPLKFVFVAANDAVNAVIDFTLVGSRFLFGSLVDMNKMGFIFAFQVLPTIIFMAALISVFYHLGLMQKIVKGIAVLMQKTTGTSGAESLSTAANIFVGQTEAPLIIKPFIAKMTRSELFCIMVGGMASVAGGVLAAYVGMLKDKIPDIAGHLITASFMSGPATLVIAKLMYPEKEKPETSEGVPREMAKTDHSNVIEAAAAGASEGLGLAFNVAAMLLAFIALIALVNGTLGWGGDLIGFSSWGADLVPQGMVSSRLSLEIIFGWVFAPIAWLMGIPWAEAGISGALLGEKVALNEFVAYLHMAQLNDLSPRTMLILSYALCGFANFSSIAIQIGGISGMAPHRRKDIAQLGIKCVIGGSLCTFMVAAMAGFLS